MILSYMYNLLLTKDVGRREKKNRERDGLRTSIMFNQIFIIIYNIYVHRMHVFCHQERYFLVSILNKDLSQSEDTFILFSHLIT